MPANPNLLVSKKQRQGSYYEQIALAYLQRQGLQLIARNWQQPKVGEIDLIMQQSGKFWDTLVLVEVRKRKIGVFGDALMSITPSKQRKLIKTARYFLQQHPKYANFECRFDVVGFNVSVKKSDAKDEKVKVGKVSDKTNREAAAEKTTLLDYSDSPEPQWIQGAFVASAW